MEKFLNVLAKNLGYTVVLVAALVLFAVFSDGLINGLITSVSALVAFTCINLLFKAYKEEPAAKPATKAKPKSKSKKK